MKRNMLLIITVAAVLVALFQAASAQNINEYWLPIMIGGGPPQDDEYLPPGDYLSRSGEWVVTLDKPKLIIEKEYENEYEWFFIEIRYKDYLSITAWVREWEIDK